ncbi:MAG TPA: endo-1,4-beta-xylanase [Terriglobales bacterium]
MLALLSLLAVLLANGSAPPATLRRAAAAAGLLVGTAVRPYALSEAAYSQTLGREFNMVEPEDSMKWWIVRRQPGVFDFHEGDQIVRFARTHDMKVRGHCLLWDHNNPQWLTTAKFTPQQLARLLQEHIATVMKHYASQVFAWDVVNEAFDEHGNPKDSIWFNQPGIGFSAQGTAYIEQAFRWARDADPEALLFYNEAEAEGMSPKSDAVYAMIKDFKHRGVPIDGVGLQLHISKLDFDPDPLAKNIVRLSALGIQVHITELDVSLPVDATGAIRDSDLQRQADVYRNVLHACLQNRGCTAVQTWGFTDKYSWIGSHSYRARGGALLFDKRYKPKPAYAAVLEELSSQAMRGH